MTKRLISHALYLAFALLVLAQLFAEASPGILITASGRLLIAACCVCVLITATSLRLSYLDDSVRKQRTLRFSLWILFALYLLNLSILLFFDARFGRSAATAFQAHTDYLSYFRTRANLIPFKGIIDTLSGATDASQRYHLAILAGNILAFAPMGFFLPALIRWANSFKRFALISLSIIVAVECTQFITMTGSMDIDDVILNTFGAVMTYLLMQTRYAKRILVWNTGGSPMGKIIGFCSRQTRHGRRPS